MPQYAILQSHPANICPMTNKGVRAFAKATFAKEPELAKRLGVKVIMNLHLDPNHKAFLLLEAPNAEAARDFLVQGGYTHFTECEFHLAMPVSEILKHVDEMPTIY